ncbi:MAG TPA: MBL fold metallo-hydrolase [Candidatus Coprocola pullicola]|nr:MBL fold metallo-hydrolase [Candidatus Coprocola pullicola]
MLKVIYLHHSGFLVETEKYCLIFDYFTENGKYDFIDITKYASKKIVVFVSHFHHDHYDRAIFKWQSVLPQIQYVLSDDVIAPPFVKNVHKVHFDKSYTIEDIFVQTFHSNDEGVAFLTKVDGKNIYHAGDLNWWHWNGESDKFNKGIAGMYRKEIDKMKETVLDVAFVPVDPRLEENYILGLDYMMKTIQIKNVFPMHFWEKYSIFNTLQKDERSICYRNCVVCIHHTNETFVLTDEEAM